MRFSPAYPERDYPHGDRAWCSKLTNEQAREIRRLSEVYGYTSAQLAKHYNVSCTTISHILQNKTYKEEFISGT